MVLMKFCSKLFKTLHSKEDPHNIALGFALGSIIGLTPFFSLHNFFVMILILALNVSISSAFFGALFFSYFAYLLDPLFHQLGYFLLVDITWLQSFWTYLYNIPIAPLTKFYNTVVLGSLVVSLTTFFPVYFGFKQIVTFYRAKMASKVNNLKIMQIMKANKFFQMYQKVKLQ
ncbi:MAG TPA: DUF2062 domain-containing protein [Firmicutes bacterium]|jgi:uncharacterized protein (TIGR03546 family)|nr:DUF2062 domain-containing protein [Bacillota bacterium]